MLDVYVQRQRSASDVSLIAATIRRGVVPCTVLFRVVVEFKKGSTGGIVRALLRIEMP